MLLWKESYFEYENGNFEDMKSRIERELKKIEKNNNVKIIYACESGMGSGLTK